MNIVKSYLKQLKETNGNPIDIICCTLLYGASPNNYHEFGFEDLNPKQRSTYVTNRLSRKMIKRFNKPEYTQIFEDKTIFAMCFSEWFGRKWVSTQYLTKDRFEVFYADVGGKFIYKPVGSAQGLGIEIYDKKDPELAWQEISVKPKAILEEWITQHEDIADVYPEAVNCLRIITVYKDGKTYFLTGGMTWGDGEKIANASATGIVSPVNFETGVLEKPAADYYGHLYECHPYSGVRLVGFKLPFWNEIIEMLKNAAARVPEIGYVGWDVAITPTGPIIIEGNTTPGYKFYQIPSHLDNHVGNRKIYEDVLR